MPKIEGDIKIPKVDTNIDIKGPKIDLPNLDIKAPSFNIGGKIKGDIKIPKE